MGYRDIIIVSIILPSAIVLRVYYTLGNIPGAF